MELSTKGLQARREYMREYKRNMSLEAREREKQYLREWRRKNPDKVRQNNIDYWERKAAEMNHVTVTKANSVTSSNAVTIQCQECGTVFTPQRKTARFCSDLCRVRNNRKHKEN